ncbi:MAG TPA: hypothetical protein VHU18_13975 [Rhizomicrobium sp.]|jgi:hypothetical protein|nr:hypothetical protein [Rhizomicrobium sp.]
MFMKVRALTILSALALSGIAHADVSISSKPTSNMGCEAGVCTATAQKAVLNVGDLQTMLASGDVAVKTGSVATDIDINQPLSWTSTRRLTLDAQRSVIVKKQVTVAGQGALSIMTNDTGGAKPKNKTGEFVIVQRHGSVQFWDLGSSLIIDGNSYTLVADIKTLAGDITANPSSFLALAVNYDAKGDGTYISSPIPSPYSGILEGLGNEILHLKMSRSSQDYIDDLALFSEVSPGGTVRNIRLEKSLISMTAGARVGELGLLVAINDGLISSAVVNGEIDVVAASAVSTGGLASINQGTITASTANVKIVVNGSGGESSYVGGLVGLSQPYDSGELGTITDSESTGQISVARGSDAGGLVGSAACNGGSCGIISRSRAFGAVTAGDNEEAGGVVGSAVGVLIDRSFATGNVTTGQNTGAPCHTSVGGLIGFSWGNTINSYALGSAKGGTSSCVGGLIGVYSLHNPGNYLANSYSIGAVSGPDGANVGGSIGLRRKDGIADVYWNTTTSGTQNGVGSGGAKGIFGLTTEQFLVDLPSNFDPKIWGQSPSINNGYPYLLANPPK